MPSALTTPTPVQAPAAAVPRVPPARKRPWRRLFWVMLVLLVLAIGSLFVPAVFQLAVRGLLMAEAWRHGSRLEIDHVAGSFYEPVQLHKTRWAFSSHAGSVARVEIGEAEAVFDWSALWPWYGGRFFKQLTLSGVVGKVEIPVAAVKRSPSTPASSSAFMHAETVVPQWWPAPAVVEASEVDLTVSAAENETHIQQSKWIISELESGVVDAGQITVKQPWLNRTFRDVHGTTRLQLPQLLIADLRLDKDVLVTSAAADLNKIAKGVLDLDIMIDAFGGRLRTQAETLPREREVQVSSTTTFSNINVASLTNFLGISEAAGGVIDEGKFTFRGALADLPGANCSLRFSARNFQWESRQWDSLVLGATLQDHRVQLPEFALRQGQNELSLSGEIALPKGEQSWWQTEFALNVTGRIENLTDLSALLLPDFQYAAGKATIDGSIRGRDQKFHGQLIVSGSDITWKKAPIKELHAAIRLNGNELQLANFDLINKEDYVHGRGVINILGPKQYWGELRASVEDLAIYSSLLQKPLVPEPLAGGAVVNWSGEGSAARYSGNFAARLQKLRSLGKTGPQLHPVNAEFEGAYSPGALQFSRFAVTDDNSSFAAKVQVGQKSVSLNEIRLKQGMETRLEGSAVLPLDVWSAWPGGDLTQFLSETAPTQFKLKASNLRLAEAMRLSGWNWPIDGGVTGEIMGQSAGPALQMEGSLELREGKLPLGWHGDVLTNVSADVALAGAALTVSKFTADHATGKCAVSGQIGLPTLRDPVFELKIETSALVPLLPGWQVTKPAGGFGKSPSLLNAHQQPVDLRASTTGAFVLTGPSHAPMIKGTVEISRFTLTPLDLQPIWSTPGTELPPLLNWGERPWAACQIDVQCSGKPRPVSDEPPTELSWTTDLHLTGLGASPQVQGVLKLEGPAASSLPVTSNGFPLQITAGSITFRGAAPLDPTVDFTFAGKWQSVPFHASIFGPMSHRITFIDSEDARQHLFSGDSYIVPDPSLVPAVRVDGNAVLLTPAPRAAITGVHAAVRATHEAVITSSEPPPNVPTSPPPTPEAKP